MPRRQIDRSRGAALLSVVLAWGCGGDDGASPGPTPTPTPGTPFAQTPCTSVFADEGPRRIEPFGSVFGAADKRSDVRGRSEGDVRELLWVHQAQTDRVRVGPQAERAPLAAEDIGDIAVIEDDGSIILPANAFDLANTGLRFRPSGSSYQVSRIDATFRPGLGTRLELTDDDSAPVTLPSAVRFFGTSYTQAFVNSDGNITFGAGDRGSTDRSVSRFLTGAPRVAAFFADLDPSVGGRVFAQADGAGLTVTWCAVRGFESPNVVTVQTLVQADGTVEVKFDAVTLRDAVVGVSPGASPAFAPVDLSSGSGTSTGALGERFAASQQADLVALAQRFYRSHADAYDQLVVWGDSPLIAMGEGFAVEFTVSNAVRNIGVPLFDNARSLGSPGRLQSVVNMDRIAKYPVSATERFLGENNVLSLLGQESGHRWLSFLEFIDANRERSRALLGRDDAHWSFFFDSDASVMEGNDIEALGGGQFRTTATVQRYSRLDQYAMGLLSADQVPPFFYVESPVSVVPSRGPTSAPQTGVTFSGTRRDVLMADVVAAMGPRAPSAAESPKIWRQAWIYVVRRGTSAGQADVARINGWRTAWQAFFLEATEGRMRLEATLR